MVKSVRFAVDHGETANASRHFRLSQHGLMVGPKRKTHMTIETFENCVIGFGYEKKAMGFTSIAMSKELGMCWTSKPNPLLVRTIHIIGD